MPVPGASPVAVDVQVCAVGGLSIRKRAAAEPHTTEFAADQPAALPLVFSYMRMVPLGSPAVSVMRTPSRRRPLVQRLGVTRLESPMTVRSRTTFGPAVRDQVLSAWRAPTERLR